MLFYVQQVGFRERGSRTREALLDVRDPDDHVEIARAIAGPNALAPDRRDSASMLKFTYKATGRFGFREGSWYEIPTTNLGRMRYRELQPAELGAGYTVADLEADDPLNPSEMLAKGRFAEIPDANGFLSAQKSPSVTLEVVNCGQGNWNEVHTPDVRLIYDPGASRAYTTSEIDALVKSRKIAAETKQVVVFISHWDVDHFHALLRFTQADLNKIRTIYAPSQVPDTATFKRVKKLLDTAKVPMRALPPAPIAANEGRAIRLRQVDQFGNFRVFRATPGAARNQTGIVILAEGQKHVAVLTGDHDYQRVLDAVAPTISGKPCVLVAPHHGAHAGGLDVAAWKGVASTYQVAVSTGTNQWGHPLPGTMKRLRHVSGSNVSRTDVQGTTSFAL
jgi:beta-lactamase superfamily II metal-dependent hydrolase